MDGKREVKGEGLWGIKDFRVIRGQKRVGVRHGETRG